MPTQESITQNRQSDSYADFKDIFVKSNMEYYRRVFKEKKEKSSPTDSKKDYFQSIIYGKNKVKLIDEEYKFDEGIMMSSTDLNGITTYVNRKFCEISGYTKDELVGKNHNIIRHPHMPHVAFKELWSSLHSGNEWDGIIKNLRNDGRYFWVYSHIMPIIEDKIIIGYSAKSKPVLASELSQAIELYKGLLNEENNTGVR